MRRVPNEERRETCRGEHKRERTLDWADDGESHDGYARRASGSKSARGARGAYPAIPSHRTGRNNPANREKDNDEDDERLVDT